MLAVYNYTGKQQAKIGSQQAVNLNSKVLVPMFLLQQEVHDLVPGFLLQQGNKTRNSNNRLAELLN